MFFLFFPIKPNNKNSNPDYKNTNEKKKKQRSNTNTDPDHNNTNEKKETEIKKFLHVLQLVFHLTACSSQIKPSIQELKPITRTPKKRKNKLSSLTLSLMNSSSPIHSQQEQLSRSQDPNNMTTQNQDQLSQSQDPNSMTHKTNPNKTQQDPNRMTDLTDLKKSAAASVVEVDSLGSEEERCRKIHPYPPKPQATTPKSP